MSGRGVGFEDDAGTIFKRPLHSSGSGKAKSEQGGGWQVILM